MPITITITADSLDELNLYATRVGLMAAQPGIETRLFTSKTLDLREPKPVNDEPDISTEVEQANAAGEIHPSQMKGNAAGEIYPAQAAVATKRTRRTKEQIAADEAAKAEPPAAVGPDEAAKLVHAHDGEVLPKVTIEFLREEMQRISTDHSIDATRNLLKKFNVPRVGALDESQYEAFAIAAKTWTAESK